MNIRLTSTLRLVMPAAACLSCFQLVSADDIKAAQSEFPDEYLMELARAPLDINSAAVEEIALLPGISFSSAAAIVERREQLGCFRSLSDLIDAGGLTEPAIAGLRPYVTLGPECADRSRLSLAAECGIWRSGGESSDAARKAGGAGDVYLDLARAKLRMRYRNGCLRPIGGIGISLGRMILTAGDIRVSGMPPLVVELAHDVFGRDRPFPQAPTDQTSTGGERVGALTGGAGERLRGVALEGGGRVRATFLVGTVIGSWGSRSAPAGLLSVRCVVRPGLELCGGGFCTSRRSRTGNYALEPSREARSADTFFSAACGRGKSRLVANVAAGASGGAWLVSVAGERDRWNRLALVAAGRWGGYANPLGLRRFRTAGNPFIVARMAGAGRPRLVGSVRLEQLLSSDAAWGTQSKRTLSWQRRLLKGTWIEGDIRDESSGGVRDLRAFGVKLIRRCSREGWAEVLCKTSNHGDRVSSLVGWRVGAERTPIAVEMGGFSFRGERALYFYEREIVGRSSIKALKGEGIGWYLCLRMEPTSGSIPASILSSAEIKLRRVVRWDDEASRTFLGVQIGRRGG